LLISSRIETETERQNVEIDRTEVSRSLAKAIAYKACGKHAEAEAWARKLVEQLECANILKGA
jgi:hypothetical protein